MSDRAAPSPGMALLLIAISGVLMGRSDTIGLLGSLATAGGLVLAFWYYVIAPMRRKRKLKHPVRAHFTNRNIKQTFSGRDVRHDSHHLRTLVLPSHSDVSFELGFNPKIHFYVGEIAVHVGGDEMSRPKIHGRVQSDIESGEGRSADEDYVRLGVYHAVVRYTYNVGTHRVGRFLIKTNEPGRYPVRLSFLTNEIEGKFEGLELLVEDKPQTIMRCHKVTHGLDCRVSPIDLN